jgi:hypothetical protein
MIGDATYPLTEWEWFKTQLRLRVLEIRGRKFVTVYTFAEQRKEAEGAEPQKEFERHFPEALVQCSFWCETTDRLLKKKARRTEHLEFYVTWVESEEQTLRETVALFPTLSKEFDLTKHVVYTILHSYGMGSVPVCHFYNRAFHWSMSTEMVPE